MHRSIETILTTHVGRLAHPPELNEALSSGEAGRRTEGPEFRADLTRRVLDSVAYQRRLGIDVVNDGGLGKLGWHAYAHHRLSGFRLAKHGEPELHPLQETKDWQDFRGYYTDVADSWMSRRWEAARSDRLTVCDGPIGYVGQTQLQEDIGNLLRALDAAGLEPGDGFGFSADAVGRENVVARTDCGLGERVHPEIEEAKLPSLVGGARIASQRLWRSARRGHQAGAA